ncbi:hypothetical protein ACX0G9_07235 [Flavitalea flava]
MTIEQYRHENESWERMLEFLKQETSFLKHRLVTVLKEKDMDKGSLVQMEHFQSQFIQKEEAIDTLRHDVHEQEIQLQIKNEGKRSMVLPVEVAKKRDQLKKNIDYIEAEYNWLKKEFNAYLSLYS